MSNTSPENLMHSIDTLSQHMLVVAREKSWEALQDLQSERGLMFAALERFGHLGQQMDPARVREWLTRILDIDAEVIGLTCAQMDTLGKKIQEIRLGKSVRKAYCGS